MAAEEEFDVWKKNSPFLYDLVISHPLEWPSLTVEWLPHPPEPAPPFAFHNLLLGTHTSGDAPNFLMLAAVAAPLYSADAEPSIPQVSAGPIGVVILFSFFIFSLHWAVCDVVLIRNSFVFRLHCVGCDGIIEDSF